VQPSKKLFAISRGVSKEYTSSEIIKQKEGNKTCNAVDKVWAAEPAEQRLFCCSGEEKCA
jgi:hypothetical protein